MSVSQTIRALIVDDEPPARDELAYLLTSYPDVRTSQAQNAAEALDIIRGDAPDLVFLDIQMPGKDGFHVLHQSLCLPASPLFVFVTAYDQYAVRAFDENALDYLLKPISAQRLQVSMTRVREQLSRKEADQTDQDTRDRLTDMLAGVGQGSPLARVTVEKNGRIQLIPAEEVLYFETVERKILVHFEDETLPCHGVSCLDELQSRLTCQPLLKANRNTLVNVGRIKEYAPWTGGRYCLVLNDAAGTELTLSRGRVKEFKKMLGI